MLMMTAEEFQKLAQHQRDKIAAKLIAEADAQPKWEVHNILKRLAKEIQAMEKERDD